jgi:histidinol-phosphate phosphatase family protein
MRSHDPKNKAFFYDRDGVIIEAAPRGEYVLSWDGLRFVPGVKELMRYVHARGYFNIVVTNQSPIGRGMVTLDEVKEVHKKMNDVLDGLVHKIYLCPHVDADQCNCRKPKPGMLLEAIEESNLDPSTSFMVGDSDKDMLAGDKAGVKTIFIKNAFNAEELERCVPDFVINSLEEIIPLLS